jgi:hypothetical protein
MLFGSVSVVISDHLISDVLDCPGMIEHLIKSEYLSSATQSPQWVVHVISTFYTCFSECSILSHCFCTIPSSMLCFYTHAMHFWTIQTILTLMNFIDILILYYSTHPHSYSILDGPLFWFLESPHDHFHGIIMLHYISIQYSTIPKCGILLFYPIPYCNMHGGWSALSVFFSGAST